MDEKQYFNASESLELKSEIQFVIRFIQKNSRGKKIKAKKNVIYTHFRNYMAGFDAIFLAEDIKFNGSFQFIKYILKSRILRILIMLFF